MATSTASKFKYSTKHQAAVAKLSKSGFTVTEHGYVYDKNGDEVCRIANPTPEVVTIPLSWEIRHEQRQTTVVCQKLSGSHQSGSKAPRKSSSDGMRTPSTWGSAPAKAVFVADTYEVTVSYTVTVATNNLGEVQEFSVEIPENLNALTGYGKQTEYTLSTVVTPDLPAEKQEIKQLTREDWLNHYYEQALIKSKEPAPAPAPVSSAPTAEWKKGHQLYHPTHGVGEVEKVFVTSAMTTLVVKFENGTKMIDPSTLP